MKMLIAEDEFVNRRLLQTILQPYGICEAVINGREAVEAFHMALEEGKPYKLICLDIMMPELDGLEVLKEIRKVERELKIPKNDRAKIVMTTAFGDFPSIKESFEEQCEAYLIKPITKEKIEDILREIHLTAGC